MMHAWSLKILCAWGKEHWVTKNGTLQFSTTNCDVLVHFWYPWTATRTSGIQWLFILILALSSHSSNTTFSNFFLPSFLCNFSTWLQLTSSPQATKSLFSQSTTTSPLPRPRLAYPMYNRNTVQWRQWGEGEKAYAGASTQKRCPLLISTQGCARFQGQEQGFTSQVKILCLTVWQESLSGVYIFTRYNNIFKKFSNVNKKNHTGLVSWDFTISNWGKLSLGKLSSSCLPTVPTCTLSSAPAAAVLYWKWNPSVIPLEAFLCYVWYFIITYQEC